MFISCDKCNTKYKVDESVFKKPSLRVKCSKCQHVFTAYKTPPPLDDTPFVLEDSGAVIKTQAPAPECKIICVCNQKGGVAKTSTCLNLASALSAKGKRVLLIDFDVQANLSLLLRCKNKKSFFEVMDTDDGDLTKAIVKTKHGIWLLPSNSRMALASKKYLNQENFEYLLREKLARIKKVFDYIIIDTPPSGDFYTLNALLASDLAIIPTQCDYLSMNGVAHIVNMINVIKNKTNHKLDYRGLATLYTPTNTVENVIYKKLKTQLAGKMFDTVINRDSSLQESHIARLPVIEYDENSQAGKQYLELSDELLGI
ncbi:MAG: zinc-ribbon domain-containing protein [Gammaproteobacteria bacterium]|nr:zinc-ribbon domain-containing protein [Gammaproteobacteria bacterium]